MRPSLKRWLAPIPAALALQAVYGLQLANGVFVAAVHDASLTKAIGLTALTTSAGITTFGIKMHQVKGDVGKDTPRLVALFGTLGISAQVFMGLALQWKMPWLLYLAAGLMGLGSGAVYVVSILVLQAWVPESPGIITGSGMLLGGVGSLFGIYAFQEAIELFGGPLPAMKIVGLLSGVVSFAAALAITYPPAGWSAILEVHDEQFSYYCRENEDLMFASVESGDPCGETECSPFVSIPIGGNETRPLLSLKVSDHAPDTGLSIFDIILDPAFLFVFVSVSAAVGPGFGFVLSFPRMANTLFALDLTPANQLLFWITLVGVVGRIIIGLLIDLIQAPSDAFASGFQSTKYINTTLLALQSMALAVMPLCIRYGWSTVFSASTAVVYITFSGGAVISACLARSVFSAENSTLVFALLGVAVGIGRVLFSLIVAACESEAAYIVDSFEARRLYEYDTFVHVAFIVSTIGLISSYFVSPSKSAIQNGANSPVFVDKRS